jgi:hypothetical protein
MAALPSPRPESADHSESAYVGPQGSTARAYDVTQEAKSLRWNLKAAIRSQHRTGEGGLERNATEVAVQLRY